MSVSLIKAAKEGFCVPYGTGKGNIRGMIQELHRQKFHGLIGIEYNQHTAEGEAEIAQCVTFFDQACQELFNSSAKPK